MLYTVSTVKETREGLERFVSRNLAAGIDHMIVFVDDADPTAMGLLEQHPHVTGIATGPDWWSAKRPEQLNARQCINANVARTMLAVDAEAQWLFHIDGDEVLVPDPAALAAVPAGAGVVHATVMEAVSRRAWPDGQVTHFKRLLDEDDLTLLHVLGSVDRPRNEQLFHGHVKGKSGMRPRMDRWATLHEVTDAAGTPDPPYDGDVARVLHYESSSGEEFVRKWTNLLTSGSLPSLRGARESTAKALRGLLARDLPEPVLRDYLMRIYERTTQDDFDTLRELGLLTELDPLTLGHSPAPLPEPARARLDALVSALTPVDKRVFRTGENARRAAKTLRTVARELESQGYDAREVARFESVWSLEARPDAQSPAEPEAPQARRGLGRLSTALGGRRETR